MTGRQFANWRLPPPRQNSLSGAVRAWSRAGYRIHRCYEEGHENASGQKKGKNPIGKWAGMWSWPFSDEEVDEMFEPGGFHDRSQMIALIVPEGMVIFDIDDDPDKGFVAEETLPAFCEHFGLETDEEGFPIGVPIVRTPSGGYHLYFTLPAGMKARNWTAVSGKFVVPGIDLRTSGGGIALIPPSVRENGTRYQWARWHEDVPPCNEKLVEALTPPERETVVGVRRDYTPSVDGLHPYMAAVLENTVEMLNAAGQGGRNATLNQAALTLAHWVAGGEISAAEARAAIRGTRVYAELVAEDGESATEATLKSGWEKGLQEPKNVPPPKPEFDMSRYNTPELDAHFASLGGKAQGASPAVEALKTAQAERRGGAEVAEDLTEGWDLDNWFDDWLGGEEIGKSRATMLLGSLVDREASYHNFRIRPARNGDGTILMCAYRDPNDRELLGLQEVHISEAGEIQDTRTRGRPFRGVCTFRRGGDVMILGHDLSDLVMVHTYYRSLGVGKTVGVGMFQEPNALETMNFMGLPKSILLVLMETPENHRLAKIVGENNAEMGFTTDVAWLGPADEADE